MKKKTTVYTEEYKELIGKSATKWDIIQETWNIRTKLIMAESN